MIGPPPRSPLFPYTALFRSPPPRRYSWWRDAQGEKDVPVGQARDDCRERTPPWLAVGPQSNPARDPPWAYIKAKRRSHAASCCVAVRDGAGAVRDVGAGSASVGPWSGAAGAAPVQGHHSDTGAAGESRFDPDALSRTNAVLHARESARLRDAGQGSGAVPPPGGGHSRRADRRPAESF